MGWVSVTALGRVSLLVQVLVLESRLEWVSRLVLCRKRIHLCCRFVLGLLLVLGWVLLGLCLRWN